MKSNLFSDRTESNRPQITRRRVIATVAGASTVGVGAIALGSREASAEIAFGELSIPDASLAADDPDPTPVVAVTAALEYDVDAIDSLTIDLLVGSDSDDRQVLDSESMSTGVTSTDTTRDLSAPITDADAFDASMFQPDAEETVTETVSLALRLTIEHDADVVAEALVDDTATIQVTNTADEIIAQLGGDGEITFE